jgi:hypothetical protein
MATFNKFNSFIEEVYLGTHALEAATDVVKVFLTNEQPLATDTVKGDMVATTEENGYAAADITNDFSWAAGTGTLTGVDVEWTAGAGGFGPFQFAVLYNDDKDDKLIGWWDYGSSISCAVGEKFKVDFGESILTIA